MLKSIRWSEMVCGTGQIRVTWHAYRKKHEPGPTETRIRPPLNNPTIENLLELELTMIVSNNEPLVRQTDGRHVVCLLDALEDLRRPARKTRCTITQNTSPIPNVVQRELRRDDLQPGDTSPCAWIYGHTTDKQTGCVRAQCNKCWPNPADWKSKNAASIEKASAAHHWIRKTAQAGQQVRQWVQSPTWLVQNAHEDTPVNLGMGRGHVGRTMPNRRWNCKPIGRMCRDATPGIKRTLERKNRHRVITTKPSAIQKGQTTRCNQQRVTVREQRGPTPNSNKSPTASCWRRDRHQLPYVPGVCNEKVKILAGDWHANSWGERMESAEQSQNSSRHAENVGKRKIIKYRSGRRARCPSKEMTSPSSLYKI